MQDPKQPEFTRWRDLENPISPLDPIQPDSYPFEPGKLPVGCFMLIAVKTKEACHAFGPEKFVNPENAQKWLDDTMSRVGGEEVQHMVIPKPVWK